MKRTIQLISTAIILLLIVSSCGKQPAHMNVIPGDAFGVMLINPGDFDREKTAEQIQSNEDYKETLEELKKENEEMAKILDDFIKDPSSIGINTESEMYFFVAPLDKNMIFGMVMEMQKPSKFEEVLKKIAKEEEMPVEIEDADGFQKVTFPNGIAIWDSKRILVLASDTAIDAEKEAKKLLNQKASESISQNKDYMDFYGNCLGLNFWMSSSIDNLKNEMEMIESMLGVKLSKNFAHLHLGWDDKIGEFTMTFKIRVNEEIRSMDPEEIIQLIEDSELDQKIPMLLGQKNAYQYGMEEDYADEYLEDYGENMEDLSEEDLEELYKELEAEMENYEE
ncbi:MAG: DUF4836 family protein [Bacteroidales bacterium]|jgi:hypothetical protein|nr:DUF4836 family protein [Bacteroidales bacterium]